MNEVNQLPDWFWDEKVPSKPSLRDLAKSQSFARLYKPQDWLPIPFFNIDSPFVSSFRKKPLPEPQDFKFTMIKQRPPSDKKVQFHDPFAHIAHIHDEILIPTTTHDDAIAAIALKDRFELLRAAVESGYLSHFAALQMFINKDETTP